MSETPLEPDIEIVDAHHHLWPADGVHARYGAYPLEALHADMRAGHNVTDTVYVECSSAYREDGPEHLRPVGETEWVCAMDDGPAAMIGFADMFEGERAGEVLDAHVAAGGDTFKGIRHPIANDPSPDVRGSSKAPPPHALADERFRAGVHELATRDLIYETWGYFHQLDDLADLARDEPELRIVLDHLGGPVSVGPYAADREAMLAAWREAMQRVAERPNITLKIGGLGFEPLLHAPTLTAHDSESLAEYWQPVLRFCVDTFGAERCMAESNFPVDRLTCDYVTLWNAFKLATADLPQADREQVFAGTARRVYRF